MWFNYIEEYFCGEKASLRHQPETFPGKNKFAEGSFIRGQLITKQQNSYWLQSCAENIRLTRKGTFHVSGTRNDRTESTDISFT